jgi:hypothetical protein
LGIILLVQIAICYRIKGKSVTGCDTLESTANTNADLVFLGSSRCWAHFDPKFFEKNYKLKSVNVGMNGHSDIAAANLRLQDYLSRNNAPKFVMLNIDPFISAGSIEYNKKLVTKNDFARFAFFPNRKDLLFVNYFHFDIYERYVPLYALFKYQLFFDCLTLKKSNGFPAGFELNDEKWDTIKYPISDVNKKYYFKPNEIPAISNALYKLNQLCKKNNIKLICIQTPVYKVAYDEKAFTTPKLICERLNIAFVDVNAEYIRNDTNYFYNAIHLNKNGVIEINKLFKNDKELTAFLK